MLSPALFPTQTPTVYRDDQPIHQLSRMSLLVPVFTADQIGVESGLSKPNVRARACLSDSMSPTIHAAPSLMTRFCADSAPARCTRRPLSRGASICGEE